MELRINRVRISRSRPVPRFWWFFFTFDMDWIRSPKTFILKKKPSTRIETFFGFIQIPKQSTMSTSMCAGVICTRQRSPFQKQYKQFKRHRCDILLTENVYVMTWCTASHGSPSKRSKFLPNSFPSKYAITSAKQMLYFDPETVVSYLWSQQYPQQQYTQEAEQYSINHTLTDKLFKISRKCPRTTFRNGNTLE